MYKKTLSLILAVSLTAASIGPITANATTKDNPKPLSVNLLESTEDKTVIETVTDNEIVLSTIEKVEGDTVEVTSESSTGDVQEFVYHKGDDYFLLNGEKGELKIEESVDPELVNSEVLDSSIITTAAASPKYMSTTTLSLNKHVNSLNSIVTVIGGVIAAAYLTNFKFAKTEYTSTISAWLGVVGLGTYFSSKLMSGTFKVDNYRSGSKKFTGCEYLYQYRYQNPRIKFTLAGKTFNKSYSKTGGWYYGTRPCA
ncbi:hypothetical protein PSE10B_56170 [Pseudomonas amygdali pv. eriobotryae]|nr:hypothetical protein PSE10B_56170 [Pseudomonas amygdali pv. eriobotryae]